MVNYPPLSCLALSKFAMNRACSSAFPLFQRAQLLGEISNQQGVESLDVHRPNLEEIFVAHMQGTVERSEANDLVSCPKADPSAGVEEVF